MPPEKKLTKKEKSRLEAGRAELLRIELEKERQKKLAEERRRKEIEWQHALRKQQEEISQNRVRRSQLEQSMRFFDDIRSTIDAIRLRQQQQREWAKFMRCDGLPHAGRPSDLRKYIHQWQREVKQRQGRSRNWLLETDERTMLTQDVNVVDLTRSTLQKRQEKLGDLYTKRAKEVLGILAELDEVLGENQLPTHTIEDLGQLKTSIRVLLKEHLDEFGHTIMSYIERDMEIDRPGVFKHSYTSDIFKSQIWTFSRDGQISTNPKARIGEQNLHNEIAFPLLELQLSLPPSVELQNSTLRGLWQSFDHLSDSCESFYLKRSRPPHMNILHQTKFEWRKRKEILRTMLDDSNKESETLGSFDRSDSICSQAHVERSYDVDRLYAEYEDALNKDRRQAIGAGAYNLLETDVNLRKYRIIGGIYCIEFLETPQQDKRVSARLFIRAVQSPGHLKHKSYYQHYKPPPPVQPGVRRLPEEIEAEIRMIEAALDKLALITVQLPDSVIWFEPPIACRWETPTESFESELADSINKPNVENNTNSENNDDSATDATPTPSLSSPTSSPLETPSPQSLPPGTARQVNSKKYRPITLPVRELNDFDMSNIPSDIDIAGLVKDFVVPRLPDGFCVRLHDDITSVADAYPTAAERMKGKKKEPTILRVARHKDVQTSGEASEVENATTTEGNRGRPRRITENLIENEEPRELFPRITVAKKLKFKGRPEEVKISNNDDNRVTATMKGSGKSAGNSCEVPGKDESDGDGVEEKRYMFSQLLRDLDQLCAPNSQPPLQEQILQRISASLSLSRSNSMAMQAPEDSMEAETTERREMATPLQTPTAACRSSSFMRPEEVARAGEPLDKTAGVEEEISSSESDDGEDNEFWWQEKERCKEPAEDAAGIHGDTKRRSQCESTADNTNGNLKGRASPAAAAAASGKWSTRDVHDIKFNEDKFSMQFRTGRLGIFGFALNRYSNMPYQTWEIKPDLKSPGSILFSFTASIISIDLTITTEGFCVNSFQGGCTDAINAIIGQTISLTELKSILITSAVDIFPDDDAFCYTEGSCEKNYTMEMHLYACMSTLGLSHNFSWSRWNLLAGSRTAVLLIRELIEGKKVPIYSTLLVTPLKTTIIDCSEVSPSFNATDIPEMEYYADLYQLARAHAQPSSSEKQRTMDPVLRDHMANMLKAIRPLSFC